MIRTRTRAGLLTFPAGPLRCAGAGVTEQALHAPPDVFSMGMHLIRGQGLPENPPTGNSIFTLVG